jgi:hypothetical protein
MEGFHGRTIEVVLASGNAAKHGERSINKHIRALPQIRLNRMLQRPTVRGKKCCSRHYEKYDPRESHAVELVDAALLIKLSSGFQCRVIMPGNKCPSVFPTMNGRSNNKIRNKQLKYQQDGDELSQTQKSNRCPCKLELPLMFTFIFIPGQVT